MFSCTFDKVACEFDTHPEAEVVLRLSCARGSDMAAVVSRSRHHSRLGSRQGRKPRLQRHRPSCYPACSGNHFSDALWDACHATFLDFHSSVVQSRIAPPQTSQPIQTPNAGGNRGTRRSPVFVFVIALPSTELHDYFALCPVLAVHVVWIKACSKWRRVLADCTAGSRWAHWRVVFFHVTYLFDRHWRFGNPQEI